MKLADLAKKANALPAMDFNWAGHEHWHDDVFDREVQTLPQAITYIKALKERMGAYALALHSLTEAYEKMRDIMLEADISDSNN